MNPCTNSNDLVSVELGSNPDETLNFGISVDESPCDTPEDEHNGGQEESEEFPAFGDNKNSRTNVSPTFYSCIGKSGEDLMKNTDVRQVDLAFDYEIVTTENANISASVEWLESTLLTSLAEEFGLTSCGRRNLRTDYQRSGDILGITSDPSDEFDSARGEYDQKEFSIPAKRIVINGFMTAWMPRDNNHSTKRSLTKPDILSIIRDHISSEDFLVSDEVIAINYLGVPSDRVDVDVIIGGAASGTLEYNKSMEKNGERPSSLPVGIIAIIAGALLIGLMGIALLVRKKGKNSEEVELDESQSVSELKGSESSYSVKTGSSSSGHSYDEQGSIAESDASKSVYTEEHGGGINSINSCGSCDSEAISTSVMSRCGTDFMSPEIDDESVEVFVSMKSYEKTCCS
mmetsp:Transcript_24176/g.50857  ORF Transcript_24176/g.50857 Transcript_24176/m.50857 type:complete len:402 (-) Transcript_24176:162-1367(-)